MLLIASAVLAFFNVTFLPHALDQDGSGLRIHQLGILSPLLVGESINRVTFEIGLHNYSKKTLSYRPLRDAIVTGELRLAIDDPDGKPLQSVADAYMSSQAPLVELSAGKRISHAFTFANFSFNDVRKPGRYCMQASLKLDTVVLEAPPVFFDVVDPPADSILTSFRIPLEGKQVALTPTEQPNPVLQQVKIRGRVLLVYRRFCGAKWDNQIAFSARIAELPGKVVDFKVDGAFGDHNPLTITYRETTYTKWTTTHVINSIDGRPWTAAEEKHRQEKLKLEAKLPADKK